MWNNGNSWPPKGDPVSQGPNVESRANGWVCRAGGRVESSSSRGRGARGHRRRNLVATRLNPLLAAPPLLSLSPFIPSPFIWVVFCMNNILSIFSRLASKSLMWKRCFRLFQISRQLTPDRWWRWKNKKITKKREKNKKRKNKKENNKKGKEQKVDSTQVVDMK